MGALNGPIGLLSRRNLISNEVSDEENLTIIYFDPTDEGKAGV